MRQAYIDTKFDRIIKVRRSTWEHGKLWMHLLTVDDAPGQRYEVTLAEFLQAKRFSQLRGNF